MDDIALVSNSDIIKYTPLGGNIDPDKYRFCIIDAQVSRVESILGSALYEKMLADYPGGFAGLYLVMYNKFLRAYLIHQAAVEYLKIGAYTIGNAGINKLTPVNAQPVEVSEVSYLVKNQQLKAEMYCQRLESWLCENGNQLPEYRCSSSNAVNPKRQEDSLGDWNF